MNPMKKIKRKVSNKLKGVFGQTEFDRRNRTVTITINKRRHKNKRALKEFAKKDRSMINTIVHEELHASRPRLHERTTRKLARKKVAGMSRRRKNKLYSMYG